MLDGKRGRVIYNTADLGDCRRVDIHFWTAYCAQTTVAIGDIGVAGRVTGRSPLRGAMVVVAQSDQSTRQHDHGKVVLTVAQPRRVLVCSMQSADDLSIPHTRWTRPSPQAASHTRQFLHTGALLVPR